MNTEQFRIRARQACISISLALASLFIPNIVALAEAPPDGTWTTNADLTDVRQLTMPGLGAMQGVSLHDGKVYLYGDVYDAAPRVGVIREYTESYEPTGRVIWLTKDGQPLLIHPTGLTWNAKWGCFLGDTVEHKGKIYHFDWPKALADGNLDHAVLDTIDDDAAVNGCRPEFVKVGARDLLATADYGDVRPEIRLYDPENMLAAKRTSAPGVVAYRILAEPFNQNLYWDAAHSQLTCEQNVIAGRGWRLEVLDLPKAIADGRAWGPGVLVRSQTFQPHDELEGYHPLTGDSGIFVTSSTKNNLTVGEIHAIGPRESPAER